MIVWDDASIARLRRRLEHLAKRYPVEALRAAAQPAQAVIWDATFESPTVPIYNPAGDPRNPAGRGGYSGHLRESSSWQTVWRGPELVVQVGWNAPYAAPMERGFWETGPLAGVHIRHYTEPGAGAGFLRDKLDVHGRRYISLWATAARRALGM